LRILIDHQVFSLHDTGGVARYFYELGRHLPSGEGVAVEMAVGLNSSIYPFSALAGEALRVYQMHTKMRAGIPRYIVNELLTNAVGIARGRFDIYHSTYYRAAPLVRRRRLVASHFDCIHEIFPEMFRNSKAIIENKKRLYSAADAIICISESSRQDLLRYYSVDPRRASVIHLGLTRFADYSRQEEAVEAEPYILYVGARGAYKGFTLLMDAYASSGLSGSYVLQAVGGGGFTEAESAKISALGLVNRVRLVPRASERTLAGMYRNASLFVYPSLYEGFGFPPLEAMSLGCPVLTSNTSSIPEVCGDAAFYFDPNLPEALEAALRSALSNRERVAEIVAKGRLQSSRYTWERTAKQTLEVYGMILSQ
jgi:glycosyltransferase involved in cell wall biosynthesis